MDNIKIKRWICDILLFLCFTAIAFFAGKILINQWKYKKAQKEYDTLQKAVQTEKSINWKKLKKMNKDGSIQFSRGSIRILYKRRLYEMMNLF